MMRTCDVEGCDRQHRGNGLCVAHLQRKQRHGDARPDLPIFKPHAGCQVDGCDRGHYGHGYCRLHLRRLKTRGDVLADVPVRMARQWFGRYNAGTRQPVFDPIDTDEL